MKSLIIIIVGLLLSWKYTNLSSPSALESMVCPVLVFVFLVSLALWVVVKFESGSGRSGPGSFGPSGGDCGGGDGGGGDC